MNNKSGFTLIEIMVVIAVVSIFATIATVSFRDSSAESRDVERQADLRTLQAALELYKNEYGRYPEGCNVSETLHWNSNDAWRPDSPPSYWSGQVGTRYECPGGSGEYILNDLSATTEVENFAPKFIPRLPVDPKLNGVESGYVYLTNPEGTVYKIIALNTVESEDGVDYSNDFARCGDWNDGNNTCKKMGTNPGNSNSVNNFQQCEMPEIENDYAVWGGFAPGGRWGGGDWYNTATNREFFSDNIHCR